MKPPTFRHALYGNIPLIERRAPMASGEEAVWHEYDPTYRPPLPRGAVRGNPERQNYCHAHHPPKYFYLDETNTCVQCGQEFVFTAEEQKFWYETLQFNFDSIAIRCRDCRKQRRTDAALRQQIALALEALSRRPTDPHALLDLATATVRYRERTGEGNLDRALGACRKASTAWHDSPEPMFWEAKCHKLAGRDQKATDGFERFVERARNVHRLAKLVSEAEAELRVLPRS